MRLYCLVAKLEGVLVPWRFRRAFDTRPREEKRVEELVGGRETAAAAAVGALGCCFVLLLRETAPFGRARLTFASSHRVPSLG